MEEGEGREVREEKVCNRKEVNGMPRGNGTGPRQAEEWEKGGVKAAGKVQALSVNVSAPPAARMFRIRLEFPARR